MRFKDPIAYQRAMLKPLPKFNKRTMVVNIGDEDLNGNGVGQWWLSGVRNC